MREGMYLGAPPVDVRAGGSRHLLHSLLRGMSMYDQAAGGFGAPLAMPRVQHFRAPASVSRDVEMVELYAASPGLFKQRLQAQFAPPRARVTSGQLRTLVPQLEQAG
jgi:hypothetical protein